MLKRQNILQIVAKYQDLLVLLFPRNILLEYIEYIEMQGILSTQWLFLVQYSLKITELYRSFN